MSGSGFCYTREHIYSLTQALGFLPVIGFGKQAPGLRLTFSEPLANIKIKEVITMADMNRVAQKLLKALNSRGYQLLWSRRQFMGVEGVPHTLFVISQAVWDEEKGRFGGTELYRTSSIIKAIFFLRDMWYREIGRPLATDNEEWNRTRAKIEARNFSED